jgi:hypothetical protein
MIMPDFKDSKGRYLGLVGIWRSFLIAAMLLPCIVCLAKQTVRTVQANQSASDAFLGIWRLDPDKNPRSGLESKSVAIESHGGSYKITIDYVQSNGVKWYFSANTSMKAEVVSTYDSNGKQTKQEWRVTQNGPDSFTLEWLGPFGTLQKYRVAADGTTMTMRDVTARPTVLAGKIDKNGKVVPVDTVEVFDRVPLSPSK